MIRRFVLFLDHGDTTLRDIDEALRLKNEYLRRLQSNALDNPRGVADFLSFVRAAATAYQPQRAVKAG